MPLSTLLKRLPSTTALALVSGLALTACAPMAPRPDAGGTSPEAAGTRPEVQTQEAKAKVEAPSGDEPKLTEVLPGEELTGDIIYQMLLAEVALRRGQPQVAVSAYAELALGTKDPRIVRRATELAAMARQVSLELDLAELWVKIEPASLRARQLLAAALVGSHRMAEAEPHIAFLLQKDPSHAGLVLMRLARSVAMSPQKRELASMLDRLAEKYPTMPEAHFVRAYAALSQGEHLRALKEVEMAQQSRPGWEPAALLNAQLLEETGGKQDALRFLKNFLEKYPKAKEVRLQYARALAREKNYAEARSEFRLLEKEQPDNRDISHALAVLALQLGDLEDARARFKDLLDEGAGNSDVMRMALGQIAEMRKQSDEALSWYEAVEPGSQYLESRLKAAQVLSRQKGLDEALAFLAKVKVEDAADKIQLVLARSQLLRAAGKEKEAYRALDRELAKSPEQSDLLYESALLADKAGHPEVVEPRLRKLIKLKPEFAHGYNALGYSLADRNEHLDEAEQLIRKAMEMAPGDPFIMDSLGWVLYRKGELAQARKHLQEAFDKRHDPEIAAHLGEVIWHLGDHGEAEKTWQDAAKAAPDNELLKATMKRFPGGSKP